MPRFTTRFIWTLFFLFSLFVVGVIGYMVIEGWGFNDALYMTAITLTAVGYSEVQPLSTPGRGFTIFLLAGGVTWLGLWFALLTSLIIELDLKNVFRSHRTMKEIEHLKDHVIVCGVGRTGLQVLEELTLLGQPTVAVERAPERVEKFYEINPEGLILRGDATTDPMLEQAGIKRAKGLIACLSADTDNLFVCLSARDMNPDLTIVARAYEETTTPKLFRAGADHVVSPNVSGAIRMASVMLRPSVVSFLDVATRSPELTLRLEQAKVGEGSSLLGKTLEEARIPSETGLLVIALRKGEMTKSEAGQFLFNPAANTRLQANDEMIVLGTPEQIEKLRDYGGK